jgi:uncharacterized protein with NRDE domain
MCLLAVVYGLVEDAPVIVGANREEAYHRGGLPPRILVGPCRSIAGIDPYAGGTWLGVNERGVLVAVTNRRKSQIPPQPRSRGLLARDLLGFPSAAEAEAHAVAELSADRYAGANFLCADRQSAVVLHAGDEFERRQLDPGIHVLTAGDINDTDDPRLAYALGWLRGRQFHSAAEAVNALQDLCSQSGGTPSMVLRGPAGGTVSSTVVALRPSLQQSIYLHAQGPPDVTPYQDFSSLLGELARANE